MGSFDIVQYEVHVYQEGHWSVRARYPRSDREHAFTEARQIDLNEGHPARVVRDVYDPHGGRSQEITVYQSDRAKAAKASHASAPRAGEKPRSAQKNTAARSNERPAPFAFRATMAVGVGTVTGLLIAAIATWAFTPQQETFASVLARSPAPGSAMTLFAVVMLFAVFTLLRGPLGISRLARILGARFAGVQVDGEATARPVERAQPAPVRKERTLQAIAPPVDHDTHVLSLARVMLARFYTEAAPANATKAMEDSLGLRGLALYLAGAASELAAHLEMPSPADLMAQISPTLLQDAAREMLTETRALGVADAALVAAGRASMIQYMSAAEEHPSMAAALVTWHKTARTEMQAPQQAKAS